MSIDTLVKDEWILFQVKEGPCAAACTYCYETPVVRKLLEDAQNRGTIEHKDLEGINDNASLAKFVSEQKNKLGLEMSVAELRQYFTILKEAGINRAGLIGSEPTTHSQFGDILETATEAGMDLLVYTAGMAPHLLDHPAIKYVVLHLDYDRLGSETLRQRLADGSLPPNSYMERINALVDAGKKIDLRINFTNPEMTEQNLVFNFYDKLKSENREKVLLKYSFTTRVNNQANSNYFTPDILRQTISVITGFVDGFKRRFPDAPMYSERPLFPCSFDEATWLRYEQKGGFTSICDMEFTVYPNTGLALCPPSRDLIPGERVTNSKQLKERIARLREFMKDIYRTPSFDVCKPCPKRDDLSCQGGCLGYKLDIYKHIAGNSLVKWRI